MKPGNLTQDRSALIQFTGEALDEDEILGWVLSHEEELSFLTLRGELSVQSV